MFMPLDSSLETLRFLAIGHLVRGVRILIRIVEPLSGS
jgi:hypothetical protein